MNRFPVYLVAVALGIGAFALVRAHPARRGRSVVGNPTGKTARPTIRTGARPANRSKGRLTVRFFAAGHADSALLSTSRGHNVLIDAGRGHADIGDNLVTRRLVPYFRQAKIRRLDAFIITHPHFDHTGDPVTLRRNVAFSDIYTNIDGFHFLGRIPRFLTRDTGKLVSMKMLRRGHTVRFGKLVLEVLHPSASLRRPVGYRNIGRQNNRSLVIRAVYGKVRFMFSGDVKVAGERRILAARVPVRADVLKLGHHGRGSGSSRWLRAVRPRFAIASCGDNWYRRNDRLPRWLFNNLRRYRVKLYRTDYHGDVEFVTDGRTLSVKHFPRLARRIR